MTPTMPEQPSIFDGPFLTAEDDPRLKSQLNRVFEYLRDGEPRTLGQIHQAVGGSITGVSARIRDLRKKRFGGYDVETVNHGGGVFTYRLVPANGGES